LLVRFGDGMSRKHAVIPDTQAKPGVPLNHMTWVGAYLAFKKPDVIVHVGDHWDMPALSHWDKGKLASHGRSYEDDIKAGNMAWDMLMKPIRREQGRQARWLLTHRRRQMHSSERAYVQRLIENGRPIGACPRGLEAWLWVPRLVFTLGNHEERIQRHVNGNPELRGTLGYHSFNLERHGWEVYDFLVPVKIDGIRYQHYVPHPNTGKPHGGMAEPRLKTIGYSFTSGHEQGKKAGERYLQDGTVQRALVVGSCYLHNEEYKGPQGNHHWRGIVMKHDVYRGNYDLMEVRLSYLEKWYHARYPHASKETIRYVP
jgi:hypothetical protein